MYICTHKHITIYTHTHTHTRYSTCLQTSLQGPSLPESESVCLSGSRLSSILNTGLSRLRCRRNHILWCTAVPIGPGGCHCVQTSASSCLRFAMISDRSMKTRSLIIKNFLWRNRGSMSYNRVTCHANTSGKHPVTG